MSGGWIKLEKDLLTDPRLMSIAAELEKDPVTLQALHVETLVLGGLAKLWMLADTHVGENDVLPLGVDQINKFIGIKGFCQLVPQNWLQVIDANHVKLANYHTHNGTAAKTKAVTQKRVTKHRIRVTHRALQHVTPHALPDQDQDLYLKEPPLPPGLDAQAWRRWRDYRAAIKKPIRPPSIDAAMRKLAAFGAAQAATVEHAIANSNQGLYPLPQAARANGYATPGATAARPAAVREGAAWAEVLAAARAEDFRNPADLETPAEYAEALRRYRNRAPKIDTSAVLAKLRGIAP